jgi:hypothetical protein
MPAMSSEVAIGRRTNGAEMLTPGSAPALLSPNYLP